MDEEADGLPSLSGNLMYYRTNAADPHLKMLDDDDDSSELENLTLQPTDLLLIGARSEEQAWSCAQAKFTRILLLALHVWDLTAFCDCAVQHARNLRVR